MNESEKIVATSYQNETIGIEEASVLQNIVYMCAYSLTGIVALFGNFIVVHVVFTLPKMRTFVHILLANMAVSDIICAISFFTGLLLCSDSTINYVGNSFCVTNKAVQLLTFQMTSFTMVVIAVDRWLSVFFPFHHSERREQSYRLLKVIIGIWIASVATILTTSPSLAYQRYFNSNGVLIKCEVSKVLQMYGSTLKIERIQLLTANLAHFWLPLAVITCLYGLITLKVWKRRQGDDLTESQMNQLILQKWKTIKMLIATVVVFILCWLPFFIFNFIAFKSDASKKRPCNQNISFLVVIWMAFSSCCYNPLIYWIYNESYRNGILTVLKLFKCNRVTAKNDVQSSKRKSYSLKSIVTFYRSDS